MAVPRPDPVLKAQSLPELLGLRARHTPASPALRYFEENHWTEKSFADLHRCALFNALFLADLFHGRHTPERAAILMGRRPQWTEVFFGACWAGTAVPVDPQLPEDEILHILRDSEASVLYAESEYVHLVLQCSDSLPSLKHVIITAAEVVHPPRGAAGPQLHRYESVVQRPRRESIVPPPSPSPETPAAIIYTSGTTGRPHGVLLTHSNLVANVKSCLAAARILPGDHFLLVLPLHHSFALTANLLAPIAAGVPVSMVRSLRTVAEDMRQLHPTILLTVPLMLYKMKDRAVHQIRRSPLARILSLLPGGSRLVGIRLRRSLGGRLRMIVVGGAACDARVLRWFRRHGIPVIEGYGLTEAGPVLTLNPPERPRPGSAGRAVPGVEIQIQDPGPDGVGEIIARGPNVSPGYHNDPEATSATFRNGWLFTGDLGRLDADGFLFITGRRKNLIVTPEGKNINPEEIESHLLRSPYIAEALALASSQDERPRAETLSVIVVPDMEALDALAEKRRRPLSDQEIQALLRDEVRRLSSHLPAYKRPRRVKVRYEPFEKTTTGKIKRFLYF
ncbi:MAG TPA: long-chain fatty acid--CoA ligase [Kiritimatiellae bacterium]|nr:long-chain fatty acid--CoA ligase [Kiritimatiellia bacterium]